MREVDEELSEYCPACKCERRVTGHFDKMMWGGLFMKTDYLVCEECGEIIITEELVEKNMERYERKVGGEK